MSPLLKQVETKILERSLFAPGEKVLVGVSGGVDSMVLLHVLRQLAPAHKWRLTVAHLNHRLRGRSSDRDQEFVRAAAASLKLPFVTESADVKGFARRHKVSIEMAARGLRHEFLARVAQASGITKVALAHHADDQIELFLLRLLRGTGLEGLAGMKWSSPSPSNVKIQLIRPLLNCSRREIIDFAREQVIRFREDASNLALDFQRNRIRHELRPLLERNYQPALSKVVLRLMAILSPENDLVSAEARRWLKTRQPGFSELGVALQRRVLQLQLREHHLEETFELIEQLRLSEKLPVSVEADRWLIRDRDGLVHIQTGTHTAFNPEQKWVDLSGNSGIVLFGNLRLRWKRTKAGAIRLRKRSSSRVEIFDAQKVGTGIWFRHWRKGDRFQPLGMAGRAKLQDLFVNQKIRKPERHQLVVATRSDGEIFWVEGLRIGECCKWEKNSQALLQWQWEPLI